MDEIFADKVLALALRPNRIKYRDLWDIVWLVGQGRKLDATLVAAKLADRKVNPAEFGRLLDSRLEGLSGAAGEYVFEIRRFLPAPLVTDIERRNEYWPAVLTLLRDLVRGIGKI